MHANTHVFIKYINLLYSGVHSYYITQYLDK